MTSEKETMEPLNVTADCQKKNRECKLTRFYANCPKSALKDKSMSKSALVETISLASKTEYGDELIKFMDAYGLNNLQSATKRQLQEYIANNLDKGVEK